MLTENERFGLTRLQEQGDFRLLPGCCYRHGETNLEAWLACRYRMGSAGALRFS